MNRQTGHCGNMYSGLLTLATLWGREWEKWGRNGGRLPFPLIILVLLAFYSEDMLTFVVKQGSHFFKRKRVAIFLFILEHIVICCEYGDKTDANKPSEDVGFGLPRSTG